MKRFGFSLQSSYPLPMPQVLDLLVDAGFCAVSPGWDPSGSHKETIRLAREHGLILQSLHGPLRGMPAMWSDDMETAQPILEDLLRSATDCAEAGIPILVVHPWNGVDYTFPEEELYFGNFDKLVDHVRGLGIQVAFENLEGQEYLAALMDRYAHRPEVGFCWDSGHEHCYTPGMDFLRLYGDRLVMTHLNDNLGVTDPGGRLQGTDDLHLLPGHGKIDWENGLRRLKGAKQQQILNFELKIRSKGDRCILDLYSKMALEEYIHLAYRQAVLAAGTYFDE